MGESYSARIDSDLRQKAENLFKNLSPELLTEAENARWQLFNWLERIDAVRRNLIGSLSDELIEKLMHTFIEAYTGDKKEAKKLKRLQPELVKAALKPVLEAFVKVFSDGMSAGLPEVGIFSRQLSNIEGFDYPLMQTGVSVDTVNNVVNVKISKDPYQPIGFDNGRGFISFEHGKLVWRRSWFIGLMLPIRPAFEVEIKPVTKVGRMFNNRQEAENTISMFRQDCVDMANCAPEAKAEMEDKLRVGFDLARIRLPSLDEHLTKFETDNPGVGEKFKNVEITQLLTSTAEWIQMHLDDEDIAKTVEETNLLIDTSNSNKVTLLKELINKLRNIKIFWQQRKIDNEQMLELVKGMSVTCREFRDVADKISEGNNPTVMLDTAIEWAAAKVLE